MFDGWSLPVEPVAGSTDYKAEITEYVVDPCYLNMALRNPVEVINPQQMAAVVTMAADPIGEMVESLHETVSSGASYTRTRRTRDGRKAFSLRIPRDKYRL